VWNLHTDADALLAFEGIIDRLHYPSRSVSVMGLRFEEEREEAHREEHADLVPVDGRDVDPSVPGSKVADDPLVLSQRQIRQLARDLLADVIGTCGIGVVCDGLAV
jgi:hypothetical protein